MVRFSRVARNIVAAGIVVLAALSVSSIGFSNWIVNRNETASTSVNQDVSVGDYVGVELGEYIKINTIETPAYGEHGFDDGNSSFTYIGKISVPIAITLNKTNTASTTDYDGIYSILMGKGDRSKTLSTFYIESTLHITNDNISTYYSGTPSATGNYGSGNYYACYFDNQTTTSVSYDSAHNITVTNGTSTKTSDTSGTHIFTKTTFNTPSVYPNFGIYSTISFDLVYTFNVGNADNFAAIYSALPNVTLSLEIALGGIE